jgi:hypothetical protein
MENPRYVPVAFGNITNLFAPEDIEPFDQKPKPMTAIAVRTQAKNVSLFAE